VKLLFGREGKEENDKGLVYVKRLTGKDATRVTVPAALLARVSAGKTDFLSKDLVALPREDEVLQITLTRGKDILKVAKEQKNWKIEEPASLKGREADVETMEHLIDDLRYLRATRYIADAASDSDQLRYGVKDNPELAITLGLLGPDKKKVLERTYLFGKEDESKSGRYARQGENNRVFLVDPGVVARMPREFVDLTIFRIIPDRVEKVTLNGWLKVAKEQVTLVLEKRKDGWVVANDPDFKGLDTRKVENFVAGLCRLRAQQMLLDQSALPAHELAAGVGGLEIAIKVEGEKEPFELTVGALKEADKAYYGKSKSLPRDIFLLPQYQFQEVLQKGPEYFRTSPSAS
jgi:hypothetical protein